MLAHEDFRNFAFPVAMLPPLMTRYTADMHYGAHADAAFLQLGSMSVRSDLSCTIFLGQPNTYEGGALRIQLGTRDLRFKGEAGQAIVYPSEIGRASCRERVCQYVRITGVSGSLKKKT